MEITVELQDMFSYSKLILVVLLLLIVFVILLYFIIKYLLNRPKKEVVRVVEVPKKNINGIKNKYLRQIDDLYNDLDSKRITSRIAYQRLSILIREFIFEATDIRVQFCTLDDISKMNIPVLYELVSDYYDPEFNKVSRGNIINSINKTKEVISKWY